MKVDKQRILSANPSAKVVILTADKFEDLELFVPYFRLLEAGIQVDVAAPAIERITGENGYWFENVDKTIAEVNPDDYDLLFIPGGHPDGAPTTVRKNRARAGNPPVLLRQRSRRPAASAKTRTLSWTAIW